MVTYINNFLRIKMRGGGVVLPFGFLLVILLLDFHDKLVVIIRVELGLDMRTKFWKYKKNWFLMGGG